jgi:hypothetical protein
MTAHQIASEAESQMSATRAALAHRPALRVNRHAVLAVVAVAQFIVVLDSTIVNVVLPIIKRGFGRRIRRHAYARS